jgi:putative flippase GtrA
MISITKKYISKEFKRYIFYGLFINGIGYILYILITSLGLNPLLTITVFYPINLLIGYFTHLKHTFKVKNDHNFRKRFLNYIIVYILGYILNISFIYIFHNKLSYPHQLVQLFSIFSIAFLLFFLNKLFVYNSNV